jgi:hypothetical protein
VRQVMVCGFLVVVFVLCFFHLAFRRTFNIVRTGLKHFGGCLLVTTF